MLLRPELLFPLILFSLVMSFTPGPNNVMLMTNGLNFGLRRTMKMVFGVSLGFAFLVLCVAMGVGSMLAQHPAIYAVLKYVSALYLLYLAYGIAKSEPPKADTPSQKRPIGFWKMVALQWVNPKGCAAAVSVAATYAVIADYPINAFFLAGLQGIVGFASALAWGWLGHGLQRFLHKPKLLRGFNIVMALLLVASLYPIFLEAIK